MEIGLTAGLPCTDQHNFFVDVPPVFVATQGECLWTDLQVQALDLQHCRRGRSKEIQNLLRVGESTAAIGTPGISDDFDSTKPFPRHQRALHGLVAVFPPRFVCLDFFGTSQKRCWKDSEPKVH